MNMNKLLGIAKGAALDAGRFLAEKKDSIKEIYSEVGRDIKLELDLETEILIKNHLEKTEINILGEETGLETLNDDELTWVIDPLDGTSNYFRDLPACCVSIALIGKDVGYIGVIYDFNEDDLYYASKGKGAFKNDEKISVSNITSKEKASLTTGVPFSKDIEMTQDYIEFLRPWKKVRMFGSAALSCAYVSSGKCDYYHEKGVFLWDFAAGICLVEEAGGSVNFSKVDENRYEVHITNNRL
tara:strand:- start:701 stop:1426 length:726 start_codon:yes stop_codon:yes gene_type:complete